VQAILARHAPSNAPAFAHGSWGRPSPVRRILAPVAQLTIRPLTVADRGTAVDVINTAACWYRGFLPLGSCAGGQLSIHYPGAV